ncbi:hypothetical protein GPZ77_28495 [Streptomyces sp. QHH-9511]|uniref:hypothetical protein n=1 Tax=Streptomyces sp. QHH-9511 TaxID=2684468 RepID=UPI0013169772|nr:hypothetical protein [Streptomyces sp. QHH-9511]QGZ51797.1 hypothetical protein GPZ77_28495 [Streptomyces sp. QHH-9511]
MGEFTARRMWLLAQRIGRITTGRLRAREKTGPPSGLVTGFARPVPTLVIGELLPSAVRGPGEPGTLCPAVPAEEVALRPETAGINGVKNLRSPGTCDSDRWRSRRALARATADTVRHRYTPPHSHHRPPEPRSR